MTKAITVVLFFFAFHLVAVSIVSAQTASPPSNRPDPIPLWPDGAPGAKGTAPEDIPSIQLYQPSSDKAGDKATGATIVVCPGGGYRNLAPHEGHDIAVWLNGIGVTAVVLKYRLGPKYQHPAMMQDVLRAIRYTRSKASEWKIDPDRVGVMGFSAGGHLASTAATHFDAGDVTAKDPIERIKSRPDVAILCYPVITMTDPHAHKGSRTNLLGNQPSQEMIDLMSNEKQVSLATPPTFFFHTADDAGVPVENSLMFAAALRKAGVPYELHVYERGRHGVGLAASDPALNTWPKLLENWLRARGFLNARRVSEVAPRKPRDPEIRALIDELRTTPPEFAASGMTTLARLPQVDDEWKAEILEEAFVLAARVQVPARLRYLERSPAETRAAYKGRAHDLKFDRFSLQTAALKQLVEVNPAEAWQRWHQMHRPSLVPLQCEDTLLYEVEDFYKLLPEFARKVMTPEQIRNEEHTRFVESNLRGIATPTALIPAGQAIDLFKPNREQFDSLIKTYSQALGRIPADNRSFHPTADAATAFVMLLADECRKRDLGFGHLLEAYREYLVKQMNAPRCADNYFVNGRPAGRPAFIDLFNRVLEAYKPNLKIGYASPTLAGEAKFHFYWQTPQARNLYRGLHALQFGSPDNPVTDPKPVNARAGSRPGRYDDSGDDARTRRAEPRLLPYEYRRSLGWKHQLDRYRDELAKWKPEHEQAESDYFHQRCAIYTALIAITPFGNQSLQAVSEQMAYLTANRFNCESFADWYLHVADLLRHSRTMEREASEALLDAMGTADDQVIRLTIKLIPYFEAAATATAKRD